MTLTLRDQLDHYRYQLDKHYVAGVGYLLPGEDAVFGLLVFAESLIERIEHPLHVPVITLSAQRLRAEFEAQDIQGIDITQELVEAIAASLAGPGTYLDDVFQQTFEAYLAENFRDDLFA